MKNMLSLLILAFLAGCAGYNSELGDSDNIGNIEPPNSGDVSQTYPYGITAKPPPYLVSTGPVANSPSRYRINLRVFQGCPQIEIADNGRLWAAWIASNEVAERAFLHDANGKMIKPSKDAPSHYGQFAVIATSSDGGKTWEELFAFDPREQLGATSSDILLWKDKLGKIRVVVVRNMYVNDGELGNTTSWEFTMQKPENKNPEFSKPRLLGRYNMAVIKPLLFEDGSILRPGDLYWEFACPDRAKFVKENSEGEIEFVSHLHCPGISFAEQAVFQRKDSSLLSLARMIGDVPKVFKSEDGGRSWSELGQFSMKVGVDTKTVWGRLKSGNIIMVANDVSKEESKKIHSRSKMTAFLSEDDGKTFPYKLLLDERSSVSYPSFSEGPDGFIYIAYDNGRGEKGKHEILMAKITEADIKAGALKTPGSLLKGEISSPSKYGGGIRDGDKL